MESNEKMIVVCDDGLKKHVKEVTDMISEGLNLASNQVEVDLVLELANMHIHKLSMILEASQFAANMLNIKSDFSHFNDAIGELEAFVSKYKIIPETTVRS